MMADEAIVDPRATVEVVSLASGALNRVGDLFYILNAPVELRASQIKRALRALDSSPDCSNARYGADEVGVRLV